MKSRHNSLPQHQNRPHTRRGRINRFGDVFRTPLRQRGFALVATLMVMVLLLLIVLGMLSLSTVELRNTGHSSAQAEARANARFALMQAIGQLQKHAGNDQVVTATASILDEDQDTADVEGVTNRHYTGVWQAGPEVTVDNLASPDYEKDPDFKAWLVTEVPGQNETLGMAKTTDFVGNGDAVQLVGDHAGTDGDRHVWVPKQKLGSGAYAWWTSGENSKALVNHIASPQSNLQAATGKRADIYLSHGQQNVKGHHALDPLISDDLGMIAKTITLPSLEVPSEDSSATSPSRAKFHDITHHSFSLPVDVTTGQLKQDMNLYLEWLERQPDSRDSGPRAITNTIGPPNDGSKPVSPEKDFRIMSWDMLRHYYQSHRRVTMVNGRPSIKTWVQEDPWENESNPWAVDNGSSVLRNDRIRLRPVLLKWITVLGYSSENIGPDPLPAPPGPDQYAPRFHLYPILVLWNPYNVDMVVDEYTAIAERYPVKFDIKITGNPETYNSDMLLGTGNEITVSFGREMNPPMLRNVTIPAGETKVFYPRPVDVSASGTGPYASLSSTYQPNPSARYIVQAWTYDGGYTLGINKNYGAIVYEGQNNYNRANIKIKGKAEDRIEIIVKPSISNTVANTRVHSYYVESAHTDHWGTFSNIDARVSLDQGRYSSRIGFNLDEGSPAISTIAESEIPSRSFQSLDIASGNVFPLLMVQTYRKNSDEDLFPSKNWSHDVVTLPKPSVTSHEGGWYGADPNTPWHASAYTYRFEAINGWSDVADRLQFSPDSDRKVYHGSSQTTSGQEYVLGGGVPLGPITSLASLQHIPLFDFFPTIEPGIKDVFGGYRVNFQEGETLQMPQNNAIGNSRATPGIEADKISQRGWNQFSESTDNGGADNAAKATRGWQHMRMDRSYIANSFLWDKWFMSSVGTQNNSFFQESGYTRRPLSKVSEDFFNGVKALPNENFVPNSTLTPQQIKEALFNGTIVREEAYQRVAEFLLIAGGFNVNSISETAWQHYLASMLSRDLLVMLPGEAPKKLDREEGKFSISRYPLSIGGVADRASGSEKEDLLWSGSREVTKEQLEELARAIVREVKKRGPFQSMAEFVNRRLDGTDLELALSGALQSALDADDVSINEPMKDIEVTITGGSNQPDYPFEEAAEGPIKEGIAGYVSQADLLQSLGNTMTVRDDTFRIRAYGESHNAKGEVVARAWCEAVVQRTPEYIDPVNPATAYDDPETTENELEPVNQNFGRRFRIVSFKWLPREEIHAAPAS